MAGVPKVTEEQIAAYDKLQEQLCPRCKDLIITKMKDVQELMKRGPYFKAKGAAKLVKLQKNLWKHLCPACFAKCRKEAGV